MLTNFDLRIPCRNAGCCLAIALFASTGSAQINSSESKTVEISVRVSTLGSNGMPTDIVPRESHWNFGPGALLTHRGWQYAAYWDDAKQVSVARRELPGGEWEIVSLPDYQRTDNVDRGKGGVISRGFGDGHEKVAMGISDDGIIHLSFDHHLSTLRYRHSKPGVANRPESIKWDAAVFGPVHDRLSMVFSEQSKRSVDRAARSAAAIAPKIESVTYPSFVSYGDSMLLYLRLGGGSGSADSHLFRYRGGRWLIQTESDSKFIAKEWSGGDKTVNAYPFGFVVHNNEYHMTWCWRDTPVPSTSHDLCYAFSTDHGRTWRNNDGKVIGVRGRQFITADSPGVRVLDIAPGKKYQNGGSMAMDSAGRVHVLIRDRDGAANYVTRDPKTKTWSQRSAPSLGKLVVANDDTVYVVSDSSILRADPKHNGSMKSVASWEPTLVEDSRVQADSGRLEHDGWLSVIGQQGKKVTVIDFQLQP